MFPIKQLKSTIWLNPGEIKKYMLVFFQQPSKPHLTDYFTLPLTRSLNLADHYFRL